MAVGQQGVVAWPGTAGARNGAKIIADYKCLIAAVASAPRALMQLSVTLAFFFLQQELEPQPETSQAQPHHSEELQVSCFTLNGTKELMQHRKCFEGNGCFFTDDFLPSSVRGQCHCSSSHRGRMGHPKRKPCK